MTRRDHSEDRKDATRCVPFPPADERHGRKTSRSRTLPSSIERILRQPGRAWGEQDRRDVESWLYSSPQKEALLGDVRYLPRSDAAIDAEDLVQEYCFQIHRVMKAYDPARGLAFLPFLRFCLRRASRRATRQIPFNEGFHAEVDSATPADQIAEREQIQRVRRAIRRKPEKFRALELFYLDSLSCRDVAKLLGKTVGAAKVRLTRASARLRRELNHE